MVLLSLQILHNLVNDNGILCKNSKALQTKKCHIGNVFVNCNTYPKVTFHFLDQRHSAIPAIQHFQVDGQVMKTTSAQVVRPGGAGRCKDKQISVTIFSALVIQ